MTRISRISVVVLTKNEEAGLDVTLERLSAFDDVIVVDSLSSDRTVEIAKARGARVVDFEWDQRYPKKKQWALENAEPVNKWVLLLDADEYPSSLLVDELSELERSLGDSKFGAFDISLLYRFGGQYLRHGHRVTKRSLLHIDRARFPIIDDLDAPGIREVEGHYQPESDSPIGRLSGRIVHDDRDPVSSWFSRHNRYSDWEAHLRMNEQLRKDIASKRTLKGQIFDAVPFKPLMFFAYAFFVRAGFLDGRAGLDYAIALTMYYWQIGVKTREAERAAVDAESPAGQANIIQFVNTLAIADGGPARNSFELNLELSESRIIDSRLVWFRGAQRHSVLDSYAGDLPRRAPVHLLAGWRNVRLVLRELRHADAVLVHGYYLWWIPVVAAYAGARNIPVVLMPHGSLTAHQRSVSRKKKAIYDATLGKIVRGVVAEYAVGSEREAIELREVIRKAATSVIGAGTRVSELPRKPGWSDPTQLLTIGRIAPKKRVDITIAALRELKDRGVPARLRVGGGGNQGLLTELQDLARRSDVLDSVDFLGSVRGARKIELLRDADIFVLPSDDENFGIAVAEALASGLPVVVSEDVAAADALPAEAGKRVADPTPTTVADAIESILSSDPVATRAAAMAFASEQFAWESVVARLECTILGVLRRGPANVGA